MLMLEGIFFLLEGYLINCRRFPPFYCASGILQFCLAIYLSFWVLLGWTILLFYLKSLKVITFIAEGTVGVCVCLCVCTHDTHM